MIPEPFFLKVKAELILLKCRQLLHSKDFHKYPALLSLLAFYDVEIIGDSRLLAILLVSVVGLHLSMGSDLFTICCHYCSLKVKYLRYLIQ